MRDSPLMRSPGFSLRCCPPTLPPSTGIHTVPLKSLWASVQGCLPSCSTVRVKELRPDKGLGWEIRAQKRKDKIGFREGHRRRGCRGGGGARFVSSQLVEVLTPERGTRQDQGRQQVSVGLQSPALTVPRLGGAGASSSLS